MAISNVFNGVIWRLELDSLSDMLFVEVRNSADKTVSFASVDLQESLINFEGLTTEERWLTGIEAAYNGVLLLHNYQSENSPVHKGITAVAGESGNVLWRNFTYGLDHLSVNGPICSNMQLQPKKLFLIDVKTGLTQRNYDPTIDAELLTPIVHPQVLSILSFEQTGLKTTPYGNSFHYLDFNNYRIVSLHALTEGVLQQHLYVTNGEELISEEIINSDIQKIHPEAFIVYKNYLIYIKNKSELKVLSI